MGFTSLILRVLLRLNSVEDLDAAYCDFLLKVESEELKEECGDWKLSIPD